MEYDGVAATGPTGATTSSWESTTAERRWIGTASAYSDGPRSGVPARYSGWPAGPTVNGMAFTPVGRGVDVDLLGTRRAPSTLTVTTL